MNCNRECNLLKLYETNYECDWKKIPNFVTTIKLRLQAFQQSKNNTDCPDGTALLSNPTEMTVNILQMAIILRKEKILRLILDKMDTDVFEFWFEEVKFSKIDKDLERSWIYSANSLHFAAKFNPTALHLILSHFKDNQSFQEKLIGLYGLTPLHVAAMNSDSLSARYVPLVSLGLYNV